MTLSITQSSVRVSNLPDWVIRLQCAAFVLLYAVWILPEIVGFRNVALVVGACTGIYSIWHYRQLVLQVRALPLYCIAALFVWASFHLVFLSQNPELSKMEYVRIWKYTALGAVMAAGLGLSLIRADPKDYWRVIYFGLCAPVLIYLFKFGVSKIGLGLGLDVPAAIRVYEVSQPFYVPKTDYVAFCLPALSVALGRLLALSHLHTRWRSQNFFDLLIQIFISVSTLFLFTAQNIKNGFAYAVLLIIIFTVFLFFESRAKLSWQKLSVILLVIAIFGGAASLHSQKNSSWKNLIADAKIGAQLDVYPQWKYASEQGYPLNEFGVQVSPTNYDRVAWAIAGFQLSLEHPLGYGLIEDSFGKLAKLRWPEVSPNLSHSHSGWLDLILAVGYPGFGLIFSALLLTLFHAKSIKEPWGSFVFWALLSNLLLWCTTEVSATVTFATLIFWICLGSGLSLVRNTSLLAADEIA
ncbi:O-antigen ligase family protein [Polynucleobacter sp. MWH-Braz-FAM2G]|uniref:O-antigen ligase family protein n=1 Tax=Polynucleobacter sp. MWH-Braz-FAM2G TaxID=1855883 RepID=UPI001BFD457A|nr:O-antigen ligase family protein [Polynucleobacter sp. MWH-Braz-FAM2G]QWD91069.1 O-antigen ligase family protein [Polynucleobacter sp. MWH-Braz-FAM2G]